MGDLNAKIGTYHAAWTPTIGKYGLGEANSRGEKLLEFCTLHKLAICNTYFQHKDCRRATWTSPDGRYRNQIDFIITQLDNLSTFQNGRWYCSADIGSDHNLVLAKVKLIPRSKKRLKKVPNNFDVSRLNNPVTAEEFKGKNDGAFEPLLQLQDTDTNVESLWSTFQDMTNKITEEVVGFTKAKQIKSLPEHVRKMCAERKKAQCLFQNNPTAQNKNDCRKINQKVQYEVKRWKKRLLDKGVEEMEIAHAKHDSHELFKKWRNLQGKEAKHK